MIPTLPHQQNFYRLPVFHSLGIGFFKFMENVSRMQADKCIHDRFTMSNHLSFFNLTIFHQNNVWGIDFEMTPLSVT